MTDSVHQKPMQLVDSHCHINMLEGNPQEYLEAAHANHVAHMLCVATSISTISEVIQIAERYPHVSASVGIHPTEPYDEDLSLEELIRLASHPKVIAIGETGLDYFHITEPADRVWQQARFRRHIQVAKTVGKSLIIHTRDAPGDTIRILQEEGAETIGGVFHCFTENETVAQQALALNFYISFSGIVTFKNATALQAIAQQVPLDRMLIETDAPFLAPVPHRGKSNQPAWVLHVAEAIAKLRDISLEEVAEQTTRNFQKLFKVEIL